MAPSVTNIKSLLVFPSLSSDKALLFNESHINVGITFLQTVLGVPLHRPAPAGLRRAGCRDEGR